MMKRNGTMGRSRESPSRVVPLLHLLLVKKVNLLCVMHRSPHGMMCDLARFTLEEMSASTLTVTVIDTVPRRTTEVLFVVPVR